MSEAIKRDPNDAASDKWLLMMPGGLSLVSNKITDFDLPGVNADGTVGPRGGGSTLLPIQGDTITWDPMVFTFIVDESYENYIQVLTKLVKQVKGESSEYLFDCDVMPLSNRGKSQGLVFNYLDCRVANVSTVTLDTNASVKTLTCTLTMIFGGFQIKKGDTIVLTTEI